VAPTLSAIRSFDPLRSDSRFQAILAEAEVADSKRWRLFAKPEESDCSAGDFEAAVKWIPGSVNIRNRAPRSSFGPL